MDANCSKSVGAGEAVRGDFLREINDDVLERILAEVENSKKYSGGDQSIPAIIPGVFVSLQTCCSHMYRDEIRPGAVTSWPESWAESQEMRRCRGDIMNNFFLGTTTSMITSRSIPGVIVNK